MAAERGVVTLSVGRRSGVRLWLARVMHSSKVLMKVAHVALSREACGGDEHRSCWSCFKDLNATWRGAVRPPRWGRLLRQQWTVFGWFGPAGPGGRSTDAAQTSSSSDHQDLQTPTGQGQICELHLLSWIPIKRRLCVHLGVCESTARVNKQVHLCVCERPAFQLWKNLTPPTTSVSLRRSQLGRKSAARRGWSTPDALGRWGGL